MRIEHRGFGAVLAGHVRAGILFGALAGAALFVVEVLIAFRGRYVLVGDPLTKVLFAYLATLAVAGMLAAALVALVTGRTRFGKSPGRYTPFYFIFSLCAGALLWSTRVAGLGLLGHLVSSAAGLPYAGLFAGGFVVAAVWGRALHRRKRALLGGGAGRIAFAVLVVAMIGVFVAAQRQKTLHARSDREDGPNVVMIVLDALRKDYMSLYGYDRPTTPNMDRLGAEGVVFDKAYSHGNRTIIAMPSLFTSMNPSFHGAIGHRELISPLPADRTTIAEMLADAGYTTVALMTNIHLKSIFGMTQGFDRVDEFNGGCYDLTVYRALTKLGLFEKPNFAVEAHPNATEVTDGALELLDILHESRFFLYLHYMDTHHPYTPPPQFARTFDTTNNATTAPALFRETVDLLGEGTPSALDERGLQRLKDYYAGAIAYADYEIGRVLDAVRQLPDDRETIVIITSDHGDEFLEHGTLYHNNIVIEELIRVPLIFWSSRAFAGNGRVAAVARHIDVMPTIAELVGVPVPEQAAGESLVAALQGNAAVRDVPVFAEGDFCTALLRDNWKIVYVDSTDSYALYDLATDPGETHDVAIGNPTTMEQMRLELDQYLERAWAARRKNHQQADPETLRQLKALGYL